MKLLAAEAKLVELVQHALLAEIAAGRLVTGKRIEVDALARHLGVARTPVVEALRILRDMGVLQETGSGLAVAPLDLAHVRHLYDVRAVMEGLAFRKAAENNPARARQEGPELMAEGRRAVASGDIADIVEADMAFHDFIYTLSGNPLVAPTMQSHWAEMQRVMAEMVTSDEDPGDIWDQHEAMLNAVMAGDGARAEALARRHIEHGADAMLARLASPKG